MKFTHHSLSTLSVIAALASSGCGNKSNLSPQLKRNVACMMEVLKEIPGTTNPKMRAVNRDGATYALVEYRAAESASSTTPTTFTVSRDSHGKTRASTTLPGLFTPGEKLDTHVTDAVTKAWQTRCDVTATVMTM